MKILCRLFGHRRQHLLIHDGWDHGFCWRCGRDVCFSVGTGQPYGDDLP